MKQTNLCKQISIICIFSIFSATVQAITVYNKTKKTLYARTYVQKADTATKTSDFYTLAPGSTTSITRPKRKIGFDRQLYFTPNKNLLKDTLKPQDIKKISTINIGLLQGESFYLVQVVSQLQGFNQAQWLAKATQEKVIERTLTFAEAVKKAYEFTTQQIAQLYLKASDYFRAEPVLKKYDHQNEVATVRVGNNLCPQEKNYLTFRKPKTKRALENLLNQEISNNQLPTIAVVTSGGGTRAMLATFGFLTGLQKIGLLDAVTYISCLSGSTWAIAPWITSGWPEIENVRTAIIPELKDGLINPNIKDLGVELKSVHLGLDNMVRKFSFGQPITTIDIYGVLLANRLLAGMGNERQLITLSPQAKIIEKGDFPMPIYTAVRAETGKPANWYEFTPYEIGGAWLGKYVHTWGFGRTFENGKSKDFAPEQTLGYFMAIFGSAFALKFERLYKETLKNWYEKTEDPNILRNIIAYLADKIGKKQLYKIGQTQIISAELNNFTYKFGNRPINENKILGFADAGIAFPLPYPPVSGQRPERRADIIIILDASKGTKTESKGLKGIEEWTQKQKLPFPTINYDGIKDKALRVFKKQNAPRSPLVLYMPITNDLDLQAQNLNKPEFTDLKPYIESFDFWKCADEQCNIFNFKYNEFQANQLSKLEEFNVRANEQAIIDEIKAFINRKK